MHTAGLLIAGVVLLAAALARLRSYFTYGHRKQTGYLAIAAAAVGTALIIDVPTVYTWLDAHVFRRPNLAALFQYLLVTIAAWAAVEMVIDLTGHVRRTNRRLRLAALVAVDVAMIVSFLRGNTGTETSSFFEHYGTEKTLRIFWIVFGTLILQLVFIASITLRYTHHNDLWLRRGLRCVGLGAACSVLFVVAKLADLIKPLPDLLSTATVVALLLSTILLGVGSLLPQLGPLMQRLIARRRLRPLWERLTDAYPSVRATSSPRPTLYRMIVEIQDALAEARVHGQLTTALLVELDSVDIQPAEHFDSAVTALQLIASRHRTSLDERRVRIRCGSPPTSTGATSRIVTEATSPTILAPTLLLVVSIHLTIGHAGLTALVWGLVAAVFVGAIPLAFLKLGARQGRWEDHHVQRRQSRSLPLLFAMASVTVGLALLAFGNAPRQLLALVAAMLAGLVAVLIVNQWWKISIHAAVAGGSALVLAADFSIPGLAAGLTVLVSASWARVVSCDHTRMQVILGAVTGAGIAAAIYLPLH